MRVTMEAETDAIKATLRFETLEYAACGGGVVIGGVMTAERNDSEH
jgi:hypothetical protein